MTQWNREKPMAAFKDGFLGIDFGFSIRIDM